MTEPAPKLTIVPLEPRVQRTIVAMLEDYLELARKGEFSDLAIAAVRPDRTARTSFDVGGNLPGLVGAICILQQEVLGVRDTTPV